MIGHFSVATRDSYGINKTHCIDDSAWQGSCWLPLCHLDNPGQTIRSGHQSPSNVAWFRSVEQALVRRRRQPENAMRRTNRSDRLSLPPRLAKLHL
ncbi:hypothetical protein KC360_g31 [Hortaea werneckii]|nr:hypothetical protein KC360_g31 [Hortaea werneckii]